MKKLFRKYILYLRLWFIRRMGYKLPSLREANPVVPGQLYDHFGYIVQAIPTGGRKRIKAQSDEISDECLSCDLYRKGIPCSFPHKMSNGKDICDSHRFKIICINHDSI